MRLQIKVVPSSSRDCIAGWLEETLRVKVTAPPEKGKANKAVIKLLEKTLVLPKGSVRIVHGTTSSTKVLEIANCDTDQAMERLSVL